MVSPRWLVPVAVVALSACGGPQASQAPVLREGSLAGLIRAADSGAGALGATVVLRRADRLAPVEERTDGSGAFMIAGLPAGTYRVKVFVDHQTVGDQDVAIQAGRITGLDLVIGPRAVATDGDDRPVAGGPPLWRFHPPDADRRTGVVEGSISEHTERIRLEGAVVTVLDQAGAVAAQGVSDPYGRFRFEGLAPGAYVVSAYYTIIGRGQIELRRNDVVIEGGDVVVVPLWFETAGG